jgi:GNAT superfamily N-acetyltransferase
LSKLVIRDLTATDEATWRSHWDGYCAFYRATVPPDVTATTWSRLIDPQSPLFGRLAECDGVVLGFAMAHTHLGTWTAAPICYLEDLFVLPDARGGGVGKALIDDLLALAKAKGWSRLYWHTEAENATARRLYDRYAPADGYVRYRLFMHRLR